MKQCVGLVLMGFIVVAGWSSFGRAHAAAVEAVHPLSGYVCMAINMPPAELMNPDVHVTMLQNPDAGAPPVGYAAATVIASVEPPTNGYRRVLRFDGVQGWISTAKLKPWVNPGGNGERCTPSVMSNGRLGLSFK
jgi:hypothetical protein